MDAKPSTLPATAITEVAAPPSLFRTWVLEALGQMPRGRLVLELPDGQQREFGAAPARLPLGIAGAASLRVRREEFFRKCVLGGDIGFAESFLDGDWSSPDLVAVIAWFILNVESAPTLSGSRRPQPFALNLLRFAHRFAHWLRPNSQAGARRNISAHYDLSNAFFSLFLDPSMMYSAARFSRPGQALEEAQAAKNERLCALLRLQPTDHVLEIGTGWGGWALHAAQRHGCRVTTVTLSREQHDFATQRIAAAGLSDRVTVRLQDFRAITGTYDKLVSIEMIEALGHRYVPEFCRVAAAALKPAGLLALQFITCPEERYGQLRRGVDFIQKHIFPGSLLLSLNRLNAGLATAGGLNLHHLEDLGPDYALTLRRWAEAFAQRVDEAAGLGFDQRFLRKWSYYLAYCEAAFALRNISVVQTVHTRANNLALDATPA